MCQEMLFHGLAAKAFCAYKKVFLSLISILSSTYIVYLYYNCEKTNNTVMFITDLLIWKVTTRIGLVAQVKQ